MSEQKTILILYMELAGYVVNCINKLADIENVKVHVVAYPIAVEAPFTFNFAGGVVLHHRPEFPFVRLQELVNDIQPDLIFCGGWSDKDYLRLVRKNKEIISVLAFDNQWTGSLKQLVATQYARTTFTRIFNYAFVPGNPQVEFATRMGFSPKKIKTGVYACELQNFNHYYDQSFEKKAQNPPRKLIYTGRYVEHKGIFDLFKAFIELVDQDKLNWELHCLGTGALWDERKEHPAIHHHGFVQPADFHKYLDDSSIFVLPSHFEPWGVVVQEFAAAGFPMVLSDQIGARTAFLHEGKNGYSFQSGNVEALRGTLKKVMTRTDEQLREMGQYSHNLAQSVSPDQWAQTLVQMT